MRKNHQPFWLQWLKFQLNQWYTRRFIRPHFDRLGRFPMVARPRSCEIHGRQIRAGDYLHIISDHHKPVKFTTWSSRSQAGSIQLGNFCLVAPGVEITSAESIQIGDNCMIAADTVIHDSDWHGLYNRTRPFRCSAPVKIADNVWIGMRSVICKGVSIGENSVIGAGSIVTHDIPPNVVAAGNPARIVKQLNPNRRMLKRDFLFKNGAAYQQNQLRLSAYLSASNSTMHWLKTCVRPTEDD